MAIEGEVPAAPIPGEPDRSRADWLTWLETSKIYRLLRITEPIGIILAVLAIANDLDSRAEARIVADWQLLTTRAPGNSGKIQALEHLNKETFWKDRVSLRGIDLSAPEGQDGVFLEGIDLSNAVLTNANLTHATLSHANFSNAALDGAVLDKITALRTRFTGATMGSVQFANSEFHSSDFSKITKQALFRIADAKFIHSNFADSNVSFLGTGLTLDGSNVSGACLSWWLTIGGDSDPKVEGITVWALANHPARTLPATFKYMECEKEPEVEFSSSLFGLGMNYEGCVEKAPPPLSLGLNSCDPPHLAPPGPDTGETLTTQ